MAIKKLSGRTATEIVPAPRALARAPAAPTSTVGALVNVVGEFLTLVSEPKPAQSAKLAQVARVSRPVACSEACWKAQGPACQCSCGGRNHGFQAANQRREVREIREVHSELVASVAPRAKSAAITGAARPANRVVVEGEVVRRSLGQPDRAIVVRGGAPAPKSGLGGLLGRIRNAL